MSPFTTSTCLLLSNDASSFHLVVEAGICHRRQGVVVSINVLSCYDMLDLLAPLPYRALVFTFSFSLPLCLFALCFNLKPLSPMFSFLYLPRSIPSPCITLNSFPQCFPYSFPASVASHYISFLSLSFIFLFFLSRSRNFIRYQVVYMSLSDGNRGAGIYCTENCILICL